MKKKSGQTCRTCLKLSNKTIPLTKQAKGCNPQRTYGQLVNEYGKLTKCKSDIERLMPQCLCILCCRELRKIYAFIYQVHQSHNELVNTISKQLDCLQEKAIDLPEKTNINLEISPLIKVKNEADGCHRSDAEATKADEFCKISSAILKTEKLFENAENVIEDNNKDSTNLKLEYSQKNEYTLTNKFSEISHTKDEYLYDKIEEDFSESSDNDEEYLKDNFDINEKKDVDKTNKIYQCHLCDYRAKSAPALLYHKRSNHGSEKDKVKCKFCPKIIGQKFNMLVHLKNDHKLEIKALKEEYKRKKREPSDELKINGKLSHTREELNKITLAQRTTKLENEIPEFSDEEFIRDLLNIKKRNSKAPTIKNLAMSCDKCGKVYKNYGSLYAHQKHVHISEDNYSSCPHCDKKFKRKTNLRVHIENAHSSIKTSKKEIVKKKPEKIQVKEKRFMCSECSYVCGTISTLTIHRNRHHTGEKPYKCEFCPKAFVVSYDLKLHRSLHTGEKPHKCSICSKGFPDKAHLIKHERMHNSTPPNECEECGKRFTQRYNLLAHKRIHLKHRNLICTICNKVFENSSLLNMHRISENHQDGDV